MARKRKHKILKAGVDFTPYFGHRFDRKEQDKLHGESWVKEFSEAWNYKDSTYSKKEIQLTPFITKFDPGQKNSWQAIGDCTSHSAANVGTTLAAVESHLNGYVFPGQIATEPSYGLIKVEALGRKTGSWSDGGSSSGIQKSLRDFGIIPRADYSGETGVKEHDLRKYNGDKAKSWGYWGCGGEHDAGLMDQKSKEIDIQSCVYLTRLEEAAVAIENGFPITVCSMAGFNMNRDSNGIWKASGSWNHAMTFCGVRWFQDEIQLMLRNSWGECAGGPFPGVDCPLSKASSGWIRARDAQRMLNARGSYAASVIKTGLKRRRLTLDEIYDIN